MTPPPDRNDRNAIGSPKASRLGGGVKILATFFGVGYLPLMPGTWASLAALPLAWFFHEILVWQVVGLSLVGLLICKPAEDAFGTKDPGAFVLDEVAGMMVSILLLPKELWILGAGFILFRVLDVWKPGPIGWIQNTKTPTSIMWDDLAAGAVVNVLLQIVVRLVG